MVVDAGRPGVERVEPAFEGGGVPVRSVLFAQYVPQVVQEPRARDGARLRHGADQVGDESNGSCDELSLRYLQFQPNAPRRHPLPQTLTVLENVASLVTCVLSSTEGEKGDRTRKRNPLTFL